MPFILQLLSITSNSKLQTTLYHRVYSFIQGSGSIDGLCFSGTLQAIPCLRFSSSQSKHHTRALFFFFPFKNLLFLRALLGKRAYCVPLISGRGMDSKANTKLTELAEKASQIFSDFMTRITKFEELVALGSRLLVGFHQELECFRRPPLHETSKVAGSIIEANHTERLARKVMLQGREIVPHCVLERLAIFLKIWSECAVGQIATSIESCHSGRFLIGGFSFSENSYLFPLSIVLSGHLLSHDHYGRPDAK